VPWSIVDNLMRVTPRFSAAAALLRGTKTFGLCRTAARINLDSRLNEFVQYFFSRSLACGTE
jgi:hypothetical protein